MKLSSTRYGTGTLVLGNKIEFFLSRSCRPVLAGHRESWILKNLYHEKIDPRAADVVTNGSDFRRATTVREAVLKPQPPEN